MKKILLLLTVGLSLFFLPLRASYYAVPVGVAGLSSPVLPLNGTWKFKPLFRPDYTGVKTNIRRWKDMEQPEEKITGTLIYSVESTLHLNRTRPRRPAVGAFFHPESRTGLAHIQMEFDDGMTALIRHEVQEEEVFFCNISGENGKVSVDLTRHRLMQRDAARRLKEKKETD